VDQRQEGLAGRAETPKGAQRLFDTVPLEHTAECPELLDPILNDVVLELPLDGKVGHPSEGSNSKETPRDYQPEMNETRCLLYAHGGMVPLVSSRLLV
jgi:hypothetical protein